MAQMKTDGSKLIWAFKNFPHFPVSLRDFPTFSQTCFMNSNLLALQRFGPYVTHLSFLFVTETFCRLEITWILVERWDFSSRRSWFMQAIMIYMNNTEWSQNKIATITISCFSRFMQTKLQSITGTFSIIHVNLLTFAIIKWKVINEINCWNCTNTKTRTIIQFLPNYFLREKKNQLSSYRFNFWM